MVADFLHLRLHGVVVGDGFLAFARDDVGHLARVHQLFDHGLDGLRALGNLADDLDVAGAELVGLCRGEDGAHAGHVLGQAALVVGGHGDDVVHGQVAQHAGFNLNLFRICLPFHFVAGPKLLAVHDAEALEHLDALGVQVTVEDEGAAALHVETAAGGLFDPFVAVAVAVEVDGLAGLDVLAHDVDDGTCLVLTVGNERIDALLEVVEGLGDGGVQGYHGAGAVAFGAGCAEFKAVAGEGEGRRAVAVGVVDEQFGNLGDVEFHFLLVGHVEEVVLVGPFDVVEQLADLLAEEA